MYWRTGLLIVVLLAGFTLLNSGLLAQEAVQSSAFKFASIGATQAQIEALVPAPDNRVGPYKWNAVPNPDSTVQMIRRCGGGSQQYWCWIGPDVLSASGEMFRTNLADVYTPTGYPPTASSGDRPENATDGTEKDTFWQTATAGEEWLELPSYGIVRLAEVTLRWGVDYAAEYAIQTKTNPAGAWKTIYSTTTGDGGVDVIPLTGRMRHIRLVLSRPAPGSTFYSLEEFELYGEPKVRFFIAGAESEFDEWVVGNPGRMWLLGNEPDNFDIPSAGDALPPESYSQFYAEVASRIKFLDPASEIVFCQTTVAHGDIPAPPQEAVIQAGQFPYGGGMHYCEQAYYLTWRNVFQNSYPFTKLSDVVDSVSTHQYLYGPATILALPDKIAAWESQLAEFTAWVDSKPQLAGKPLYLTEYGNFSQECPGSLIGTESCGPLGEPDENAFYGATHNEGFWGMMYHTTAYFVSPENTRWSAAWWFLTGNNIQLAYLGDTHFDQDTLNRNGQNYRDTIDCHVNGQNCPAP